MILGCGPGRGVPPPLSRGPGWKPCAFLGDPGVVESNENLFVPGKTLSGRWRSCRAWLRRASAALTEIPIIRAICAHRRPWQRLWIKTPRYAPQWNRKPPPTLCGN
jgi:hypothetical protein